MAELINQERLQPSLLDRLTDAAPQQKQESRDQRVLSLQKIRDSVMRDLGCLLNAVNLDADHDLTLYPEVQNSVLNYGIPDFCGVAASGISLKVVQQEIREAIRRFEPRINPESLKVEVEQRDEMSRKALSFAIDGEMWAQPMPQALYLRTEVDLETGNFNVAERKR